MVRARRRGQVAMTMDASGLAAGSFFMGDASYTQFHEMHPDAPELCINYKEIFFIKSLTLSILYDHTIQFTRTSSTFLSPLHCPSILNFYQH